MKAIKKLALCLAALSLASFIVFFGKNDSYAMSKIDKYADASFDFNEGPDDFKAESAYLTEWFKKNGYGNHMIANPRKMYSVDDEFIALCFDIDNNGYVVINTVNYDIMEYSFDSKVEGKNFDKLVYAGFSSIFGKIEDGRLCFLKTGEMVPVAEVSESSMDIASMQRKPLEQKTFVLGKINGNVASPMGGNDYHESGNLKKSLVTWKSSYYCQINSASILLRYLYDYKSGKFLASGYTANKNVQKYLCDNHYLVNTPMWSKDVVNGGVYWGRQYVGSRLTDMYTTGMNQYIKDRGITTWKAYFQTYSFVKIKELINNDYPVVTATNGSIPNATWNGPHAYVVHGYNVGYDGVPYILINDTFAHNGVSINASTTYHPSDYDGMWYIIK